MKSLTMLLKNMKAFLPNKYRSRAPPHDVRLPKTTFLLKVVFDSSAGCNCADNIPISPSPLLNPC